MLRALSTTLSHSNSLTEVSASCSSSAIERGWVQARMESAAQATHEVAQHELLYWY